MQLQESGLSQEEHLQGDPRFISARPTWVACRPQCRSQDLGHLGAAQLQGAHCEQMDPVSPAVGNLC